MPRIVFATLCLNEMEWLPALYRQHKDWPGLVKWVFVESADRIYAETSPERISDHGLSIDGTTHFLQELSQRDSRIIHIPYGLCGINSGLPPDQYKCEARNIYLDVAESLQPDLLIVVDADEFYTRPHQEMISQLLDITKQSYQGCAFCFKQRHIWYPPRVQSVNGRTEYPDYHLFSHEAIGGYWDVIHCRVWRWESKLRYRRNHNWPEDEAGNYLVNKGQYMMRTDVKIPYQLKDIKSIPECIHLGFSSRKESRVAKHQYYQNRGEGKESDPSLKRRRKMYVECRNDYLSWQPGLSLSNGATVIPYTGPVPEVFREREDTQ